MGVYMHMHAPATPTTNTGQTFCNARKRGDGKHALLHKPIKPAALRALMSRILTRH